MNLIAFLTLEKLIKLEFKALQALAIKLHLSTNLYGKEIAAFANKVDDYIFKHFVEYRYDEMHSYHIYGEVLHDNEFTLSLPIAKSQVVADLKAAIRTAKSLLRPSNINNECYTPVWFIDAVREYAGTFHLDPFSSHGANLIVEAKQYLTEHDDALSLPWLAHATADYPRFWVNPPYSRDIIAKCIDKTLSYVGSADIYLLVNSSTSSKWYQKCIKACNAMLFPSKRIQFVNPYKSMQSRNKYDQTLFFFGKYPYLFQYQLEKLGSVIVKSSL